MIITVGISGLLVGLFMGHVLTRLCKEPAPIIDPLRIIDFDIRQELYKDIMRLNRERAFLLTELSKYVNTPIEEAELQRGLFEAAIKIGEVVP